MLEQISKFGVEIKLEGQNNLRLILAAELPEEKKAELTAIVKANKAQIIQDIKNQA